MQVDIASLADAAVDGLCSSQQPRYLVGITGPPGAGKSTLMEALVRACAQRLGADSVLGLPMDGFHLTNQRLAELGLQSRKGAPETFDAEAFVKALRSLVEHSETSTSWPTYSRKLHEPIAGSITVRTEARLVFLEGNYLLLSAPPWNQVREFLDAIWYVSAKRETLERRLIRRQVESGRTEVEAVQHVMESDMSNVAQVAQTERLADRVVLIDSGDPLLPGLTDPATGQPITLD